MTDDFIPGAQQAAGETDGRIQRFSYERSEPQSVGGAVVQAVASVAGVDALSLQPRLYDVIDPDALETLLADGSAERPVQISFEFGQYQVTVTNTNELFVRSPTVSEQ